MIHYAKELSDPLYGFIGVLKEELSVIDSFFFQRLRNIKQLGGAYLVFPSAHHTRFEHSIGTMYVADEIYNRISEKIFHDKVDIDYYRKIIRLSALLHDIGHPPFSHTAEVLLPEHQDHEHFTEQIIKYTNLNDIIQKQFGFRKEDIERIIRIAVGKPINNTEKILSEVITGEFGADRIDYLRRDALFCGVSYGLFDYQRFLNTIDIYDECTLCVDISGLRAMENFIVGRYFMYLQVYFHKVVRIMNIHIADLIKDIFKHIDIANIENYIKLNDTYILSMLFTRDMYRNHAERILERKHYREAFFTKSKEMYNRVKNKLIEIFDLELLRFDEIKKKPYEGKIYIKKGGSLINAEEISEIVSSLKSIEYYRIYSADIIKEEICGLLKKLQ